MSYAGIAALAVGVGVLKKLAESDHDQMVKKTYRDLYYATPSNASVYVDYHHYQGPKASGNTRGDPAGKGFEHIPDVLVTGPPGTQNLVVEVEAGDDALNAEAASQLRDFKTPGFKRALVVPNGTEEAGEAFVDEIGENVAVATPSSVVDLA